jgi:aminoglycoside phosphotransferase (APT) family kinase protein
MSNDLQQRLEAIFAGEGGGRDVRVTCIEKIGGGYSRLMRRITIVVDEQEQRLVWRADPPPEQEIVKTDRAREYAILAGLDESVGAPRAFHFDPDGSRLGAVSMVVEYVEGEQLLTLLKTMPEEQWPELVRALAALAARIHRADIKRLPEKLGCPTDWTTYMDGCIGAWRALVDEQVEPAPLMRYVVEWLDRHRPPKVPLTLLHGDFQTPNLIVDPGQVRAIDWEFARIGDPREDLGYFAAMAALSPPDPLAGDLSLLCDAYRELSGLTQEQVNPLTVAYFSILPFGPMVRQFVGQVRDMVAGTNRSLKTANLAMVLTAMVEGWIGLIHMLDNTTTEVPTR